jgi:hypothetical protein
MKLTGENRSTRGKPCLSATLSTTNPTWTELGSNRASAVRGRRLTAWAMTRPIVCFTNTVVKRSQLWQPLQTTQQLAHSRLYRGVLCFVIISGRKFNSVYATCLQCVHYKNYTTTYTTYCCFYTWGPRTSPQ